MIIYGRYPFAITVLLASAISSLNAADSNSSSQSFAQDVRPFLERHCFGCHGPKKQKSRIRFDGLGTYRAQDSQLWTKVHEALSKGEMPPEKQPQPRAVQKKQILSWIVAQQRAARAGRVRRLNRREVSAALEDLTGLQVNYAAMLPEDGKVDGFDTGADALQDAADSVSRMMTITRRAVDAIRFLDPAPGKQLVGELVNIEDPRKAKDPRNVLNDWQKANGHRFRINGYGLKGKGVLLSPKWLGDRDRSTIQIPTPTKPRGVARLTVAVSGYKAMKGLPNTRLNVTAGGKNIDFQEITGTFEKPQTLTYDIQLDELPVNRGYVYLGLGNLVETPYEVKGFPNDTRTKPGEPVPPGAPLYRPVFDRKVIKNPIEYPVPYILLQRVEFEPNYVAAWPPRSWGVEVGNITDSLASARKLLGIWMQRAWRRPVKPAAQERFIALYQKLRGQKMSFDDALRATFQSVLMSGPFRYHALPSDADPVVAQHAIASRLSFMLIGTPPDKTLRDLAKAGKLRDPKVIDAQVDRLLADPRSMAFFKPFVTQWLEIGQPITIAMRSIKNQDFRFGRHLRDSMRDETVVYVRQLVIENKPAKEMVQSDWAMMNDILAHFYGYKGIEGGEFRKVNLRKDDARGGGILGHGGIQSMLCWMGENWVIYRGAWTMRHILNDPPPTPPLEVPELVPSDGKNKGKTFRVLLKQHQADPNCAVCHTKMDPIGFAFQNFDLSGRWREVDYEQYVRNELDGKVEWYGKGKTRPLDTTGQLPGGEKFSSFAEFKEVVAKHYTDDMMRGLMKNFVLFGTGRKPNVDDLGMINSIMDQQSKRDYRIRDMLKALIRSKVFLQ